MTVPQRAGEPSTGDAAPDVVEVGAAPDVPDVFDPWVYKRGIPHESFAWLRVHRPVCWQAEHPVGDWPAGPGFWAVTRHGDVARALKSPGEFSSWLGATQIRDPDPADLPFIRRMMLNMDPPDHGRSGSPRPRRPAPPRGWVPPDSDTASRMSGHRIGPDRSPLMCNTRMGTKPITSTPPLRQHDEERDVDLTTYAELAVRLANTAPHGEDDADRLATMDGLRALVADRQHLRTGETREDLDALRALRAEFRRVFVACAERDGEEAAARLNALLIQYPVHPQLSGHDGQPWHVHYTESGSVADRYAAGAVMGLAVRIAELGIERFGICQAPNCQGVFIDTSPNRSRRYCSDRCASRANVTAFRARRRSDDPASTGADDAASVAVCGQPGPAHFAGPASDATR